MKRMMMMMAMMTTIAVSANAMTYSQARNEALFLTDKMAHELALTSSQYEAVYEINLDYMLAVTAPANLYGASWTRRNSDLRYVLTAYQYDKYQAAQYFYRPVAWTGNAFSFGIYRVYANRNHFYRARPSAYATYKGGGNRGSNWHSSTSANKPVAGGKPVGRTTIPGNRMKGSFGGSR